jgi:hypothetical protein
MKKNQLSSYIKNQLLIWLSNARARDYSLYLLLIHPANKIKISTLPHERDQITTGRFI